MGAAPAPSQPVDVPIAGRLRGSAAATTLLGLALVLLSWGLVVTQPFQIGEDAGLGHLPLEAPQGGFDPFVFADGDLGHETLRTGKQPVNLASSRFQDFGSATGAVAGAGVWLVLGGALGGSAGKPLAPAGAPGWIAVVPGAPGQLSLKR